MKTLSVKQPWASLIVGGIKNIENRTWKTNYRGRIFIHASAKPDKEPYMIFSNDQFDFLNQEGREVQLFEVFEYYNIKSAIIGSVEIVDCVINHESIWAEPAYQTLEDARWGSDAKPIYNWVLANPILFANPWLNIKGKLGLWDFDNTKGIYDTARVIIKPWL